MEQNDLFHSEEGLEVDLPPPPPPSNPPPVEDSDAEELVTNRRSIFAAPSWNSEVEGSFFSNNFFDYIRDNCRIFPLSYISP